MSDSAHTPHISPTATDQESLEYASEIAHNLVGGTYRSVPSYELRLAKAVIRLEEQLEALERAARSYRTLVLPYLDSPEEVGAAEELDYYLSRASSPASRPSE